MAEQAVIADLRVNLNRFDADLRKAMQAADSASASVTKAFDRIDDSLKSIPAEVNKLTNALQQTEQATNRAAVASEKHNDVLGRLKGVLGSLGLVIGAQQMLQFASSTIRAAETLTGINQQLTKLTGSAQAAKAEMAFIRSEATRLALSTVDAATGFARLANAAKGTRLEGQGTRMVFQALNELTRANRLSADEYNRVLNQVTQTIAKGKFQTEELITLSESGIPAFRLLGEAMGVTGNKLAEMLQKGQVSSDNMLLLANKIHKEYASLAEAAANTIPANFARGFNRIKDEFIDLFQGVLSSSELIKAVKFESNILDIFPDPAVITKRTDEMVRQFVLLGELVSTVFQALKKVITETFTGIVTDMQTVLKPIDEGIRGLFDKIPGIAKFREKIGLGIKAGVDEAKRAISSLQNDKGFQGLLATIVGVEGNTINERIEAVIDKLKEVKDVAPLIEPEGEAVAAIKVEGEWTDVAEQIKAQMESVRKAQPLIDPVTEEEAAKTILAMRKRIRQQELAEEEQQQKALKKLREDSQAELQKLLAENDDRIAKEARQVEEMVDKAILTGEPILGDTMSAAERQRIAEFEKTIENLKENIQSSLATAISDAIAGDLRSIKSLARTIGDIFTDTARSIASEFIAAFAVDPIVNQVKKVLNQLKGVGSEGAGAQGQGGGILGNIAGIGAGVSVGYGVAGLAGGGKAGGAIGGAVGGAATGAYIGSAFPPYGTIIGAAAGLIVGGVLGMLSAQGPKPKEVIVPQTTEGMPTSMRGTAMSKSPFGIISMMENARLTDEAANAATLAISEIDAGIAKMLNSHQREIVEKYFQSAVPEGSTVASKEMGDAVAKAVQQRFYHALTALAGEDTAQAVVGDLYSATAGSIQAIQARAMEALDILSTIAEFKEGDLSQTAQQLKAINQQFQELKDRATVLGLPTGEIDTEWQKQLAKVTTDFNQEIADAILGMTDPIKLEFVQLERMQEERMQNAIDAGADLTQVEKLNQLEREELEKRHQDNLTKIADDAQKQREAESKAATNNIFQAIYSISDPFRAAILSIQMQVAAFQAQADQGLIPQSLVDRYETSAMDQVIENERRRKAEEAKMIDDFNQGIYNSLLAMKDVNAAELAEMERMHAERYAEALKLGADMTAVAQLNHQERLALEQQHEEERTRIQLEAQRAREEATANIFMAIYNITDPFRAAMMSIQQQVAAFQAQVEQGLIPQSVVDRYREAATEQAIEQEKSRRAQELQIITDFNNQVYDSILGMTDAATLELVQMERIHQQRLADAEELGADLAAVDQLNQMEREALEMRHQETMNQIILSAHQSILSAISGLVGSMTGEIFGFLDQLDNYAQQAMQGAISWSQYDLFQQAGMENLIKKDQEQKARTAQEKQSALLSAGTSFLQAANQRQQAASQAAAQRQREAEQRQRAAQQAAAQRQREAEQRKREAQQAAAQRQREAEQRKREAEQRERERQQEAERRRQAALSFNQAIFGFTDPVKAAMLGVNEQVREFRQMTKDGIVSKAAVDQFQRLATASVQVDRALQALSGSGGRPIEQVGQAFEEFIRAGSPQSQAVQQMAELQKKFVGLVESAKILGLSTAALESSFKQQAKTIRDEAIKAINEEMDAKKEQLKQIDEFLAKQRVSDVLPPNLRFGEARAQFGEALGSGDVQKAIAASEQYLAIAQEQFGSTSQFFAARNEVEQRLIAMQERQAANIESEREKLIRQEERQLEQVQISRTSVDYLKRISSDNSATSRGIEQLIAIARSQTSEQVATRQLLLRLAAKIKA